MEEIKNKLQLKFDSCYRYLKHINPSFLEPLLKEKQKFTPAFKDCFKAFELCPDSNLQTIWIGQDPYPQPGVASGLAFDCSNTNVLQPSLKLIHNQIGRMYPEHYYTPDLSYLADRGVLLLNSSLTVIENNPGSHEHIWKQWIQEVVSYISTFNLGITWLLIGKKAQELESFITNQKIYKVPHPSYCIRNNIEWDTPELRKYFQENTVKFNYEEH